MLGQSFCSHVNQVQENIDSFSTILISVLLFRKGVKRMIFL